LDLVWGLVLVFVFVFVFGFSLIWFGVVWFGLFIVFFSLFDSNLSEYHQTEEQLEFHWRGLSAEGQSEAFGLCGGRMS
jgi:hypothetical protein